MTSRWTGLILDENFYLEQTIQTYLNWVLPNTRFRVKSRSGGFTVGAFEIMISSFVAAWMLLTGFGLSKIFHIKKA